MRVKQVMFAMFFVCAALVAGAPATAASTAATDWACYNIRQSPLGGVCIYHDFGFDLGAFTVFGFGIADPNLNDNIFDHGDDPSESGYGQAVGNNAGQIVNHSNYYLQVCTGVNYSGTCKLVLPHDNLHGTFLRDVESFRYAGAG